jgi:hypothetical protein
VLYDDEPRNMKELLAHPERDEIKKAGDAEIQQLVDQKVGVIVSKSGIDDVLKRGRLAVVGTGEIPGIDSSFSNFSPTVAFSAVRMLVALMVDPRFSVESYDLSGAFLETELRDRAVYVCLPAEAGEYAGKVLLLLKSVYGLKTSGREFLQQLSERILSFTMKVKCPKTGKEIEVKVAHNLSCSKQLHLACASSKRMSFLHLDSRKRHNIALFDNAVDLFLGLRPRVFEGLSAVRCANR